MDNLLITLRDECYLLATNLFRVREPHGWLKTMKLIDVGTVEELTVYKQNMQNRLDAFDKSVSEL